MSAPRPPTPPPGAAPAPRVNPGSLPLPNTFRVQEQSRPSLSYFLFLSLLFFLLNNNNAQEPFQGPGVQESLRDALHRRELGRDGLALWLGANTSYANASSPNASESVPFVPADQFNPVVLPLLRTLVAAPEPSIHFPQNLTGFVRGRWSPGNWTYDKLGLSETFNVTRLVKVREPEKVEKDDKAVNATVPSRSHLVRRQDGLNTTAPPAGRMENRTTTTNRTELRSYYDFAGGGKIAFNLREDQTWVVGPVISPGEGEDAGTLLPVREGDREAWEADGPAVYLHGDLILTSRDGSTDLSLELEAVHLLSLGTVYGYGIAPSAASHIFKIPSLPLLISPNTTHANATGHALLRELDHRIAASRTELTIAPSSPNAVYTGDIQACNFAVVAQLSPLPTQYSQAAYAEYYASLFRPSGASLSPPPTPKLEYALYSEECGLLLQGEGEVLPSPVMWERATNLGIALAAAQTLIVLVLVKQIETRGSAASSVKVAYATVGMQSIIDAYFFIITFVVGIATNNRASLPLLIPSFLALISSLLFGMSYAQKIRAAAPTPAPVQRPPPPPPPTRADLSAAAAERRADSTAEGESDALLSPASAPPPPAPQERGEGFFIAVGMSIAILALTIIIIWGWIPLMILVLYSYWLPQIVHNTQRGTARQALRNSYVIGTTLGRLVLPVYVWGCPANLLAVETSPWVYALIAYSCAQATTLLLQDSRLGARFFLPQFARNWLGLVEEPTWNYHPLLPHDEEGADAAGPLECPICMEAIEPADKVERELGLQGKLRWTYMVPPCHHVCHTHCLESWMQIKSVCPVCRGRLPPT